MRRTQFKEMGHCASGCEGRQESAGEVTATPLGVSWFGEGRSA